MIIYEHNIKTKPDIYIYIYTVFIRESSGFLKPIAGPQILARVAGDSHGPHKARAENWHGTHGVHRRFMVNGHATGTLNLREHILDQWEFQDPKVEVPTI